MKLCWLTLTIILLAGESAVRAQDTAISKIRWTRHLPPAVRSGWTNSHYAAWHIFGIHRLVTHADTLYTMDVARYQSLGPDDADIAEEYILYFSSDGKLLKAVRKE